MSYTYDYPRPALTVDCIIFGLDGADIKVLLIERGHPPYEGHWALPGGFVNVDEDLEASALRELEEETGVKDLFVEQLYTFGTPGRDPRGRVVTVAYYALVNLNDHPAEASSDAKRAEWFKLDELPELAFDHDKILKIAIERLKGKVRYQPIGFELLPTKFTLTQLQTLYETILGVKLNKRNFRTKILKMDILNELERQKDVPHRPALLYEFDLKKYEAKMKSGFIFEI
ncbi:MAG: NUDIX domain-containing protein [Bacteroidota bacterium]